MIRSAMLVLLTCASASCAPTMNGTDGGTRGGHHVINVKLRPDGAGKCVVRDVSPAKVNGLKPGHTVYWRVSNGCKEETEVTIAFKSGDPVYDYPDNPGHKKKIPGKGVIFDGVDNIRTSVRPDDPEGAKKVSKPYAYDAMTPAGDADPEIVVDWP